MTQPGGGPFPTGNPSDPDERGWLIGIGGQYTVHDLGNGRVVKIPNSMDGSRRFIGGWGPHVLKMKRHYPLGETAIYRGICIPHVLRLAKRYPALSATLAHPRAMPGGCFSQDKVQIFFDLIPQASPDEIRGYLDGYADVCQLCWRYGIHDYILFFVVNNGIDAEGKTVCVDFGEVAFDRFLVDMQTEKRGWETKDVLLQEFLPPEYHGYYFQAMTDRLSGQNFELHWARELDELDSDIIHTPDLREHPELMPELIERILERAKREEGWDIGGVSPEVLDLFRRVRKWQQNAVGLQNTMYRAAEACQGSIIEVEDIPQDVRARAATA